MPLSTANSSAVVSAVSDEDYDELDVVDTPDSPHRRVVQSTTRVFIDLTIDSTPSEDSAATSIRRSQRPLKPRTSDVVNVQPTTKKRRVVSTGDLELRAAKRVKVDEKKTVTLYINTQKVTIERARATYLMRYRTIFEPVLPHDKYFTALQKDVDAFTRPPEYVPFHLIEEQPSLIKGGTMKDYQLHGLSFLVYMYNNGMNCILGDEMGLGKTLQTLSLFAYIEEHKNGHRDPHLVVCPLSVLTNWEAEAKRWLPSMKTMLLHGSVNERKRIKEAARLGDLTFDICITTYESYKAEHHWFKTRRWTYCVLDEGHKIKNADIDVSHLLQGLGSLYRLLLTGTPVQNNLVELWSLLHWLYPAVFTDSTERRFKDAFNLEGGKYSLPFLKSAEALLSKIMICRTKAIVEQDVPPRDELTVFIPLTETQRFWVYRLLRRMDTLDLKHIFPDLDGTAAAASAADSSTDEGRAALQAHIAAELQRSQNKTQQNATWKRLMNLLMQLRRVCDHPYLLEDAAPEPYSIDEHLVRASSKLIVMDKLLKSILPTGEKVLVFSQWTTMLDYLEDFMALRGIPYLRLDGSTPRPRRTLNIRLFQQENSPYQVFLLSTKAGGLGINLTRASHVIMVDSDWNPQNDLQAIARAHRIGQTRTVKVYRLICQGSVEDQMLDRIRRKLFLSVKIMSSQDGAGEEGASLKARELMDILRKGSSVLDASIELERFLQAPIEDILAESRNREEGRNAKIAKDEGGSEAVPSTDMRSLAAQAEEDERRMLQGVAQVHSRYFEGSVHAVKTDRELAQEWDDLQAKRQRKNLLINVNGLVYQPEASAPVPITATFKPPPKKGSKKFDHEDWCIHCRDGGELVICNNCPRVFHAKCAGLSKNQLKAVTLTCSQHQCSFCFRRAQDVGGMLFRCQTCPQAFCEDCLPPGDLDVVGDTLPEFTLLGFRETSSAFFIRCQDCHTTFEEEPRLWKEWQQEFKKTEAKLRRLSTA